MKSEIKLMVWVIIVTVLGSGIDSIVDAILNALGM